MKSTKATKNGWKLGAALVFLAVSSPAPADERKPVSVKPGPEELRGKAVDIAAGEVPVHEFLRFLADFTGLPVIAEPEVAAISIHLTAPIKDADADLVQAILEANRLRIERKARPGGTEVVEMTRLAARGVPESPLEVKEVPSAGIPGEVDGPTPEKRIFELREAGLIPVKSPPLAERGVRADEAVAVVVRLRGLNPKDAAAAIVGAISMKGNRSPAPGLTVVPVAGTSKIILCGRAASVDFVLGLLQALEEPAEKAVAAAPVEPQEPRERLLQVFSLENADAEEVTGLFAAFLQMSPERSGRTTVIADPRTRKVIVETMSRKDLEDLQALLRELDIPAKGESALRTHIYQLKNLKAGEVAPALIQLLAAQGGGSARRRGAGSQPPPASSLVVPHEATNSLLIQAEAPEFESLRRLLEEMDAPK